MAIMVQKRRKISVLGTGNVGATIAYTLTLSGICSEVVLVDINKVKAEGEALDLSQCGACVPSVKVRCGEYEDVADSDIVVVTFGVGRKPGQSRLDLAKINVGILQSTLPNVAKIAPNALYIIVSNPVDVLTYVAMKCTGLPKNQIIGTGTLLDSNRLTKEIADFCKVDVSNVNSFVFGEHGDACMAPWSLCTVCGYPVKEYCEKFLGIGEKAVEKALSETYDQMVASGAKVIQAKGATYYAIACSVFKLIKALFADTNTVLPLSTYLDGEYGAKNICLGVPCMVGGSGMIKPMVLPLTAKEQKLFEEQIAKLDGTFEELGIRK